MEAEIKAHLELESKLQDWRSRYDQLVALQAREKKAHEEALASVLTRYQGSETFKGDVKTFIVEHIEEAFQSLKNTTTGRERVAEDSLFMYDISEYTL